ncbi:MAG: carbon-nitrogen hydrolase family protein [Gammaproteobacteria bacterium]|jgi:nitrilase|nr:carbon-nitrogen hydrolase family protein [Gammaproteobacteria bacterium]
MQSFTAAVIQSGSRLFDTPATMAQAERLLMQAADGHAALSVFPEAYLGGYPKGITFGTHVGSRSAAGRQLFQRYFDAAINVPGPECEQLGQLAKRYQQLLVIGVIERDGGTLYCTVLYFAANGTLLGKHRKVMPTAMERIIWGFGDGSTLQVHDTEIGRISAVICWENYMPQLRLSQYAQGVEIYCAPTVDDRENWLAIMRTVAVEGRCFVLSACQFMTRADAPADFKPMQGDAADTVLIRGGSCIVSPLGELLAGPVYDQETVLLAQLDAGLIAQGKFDLDIAGHYARPDLFTLQVNTLPQHLSPALSEATDELPPSQ